MKKKIICFSQKDMPSEFSPAGSAFDNFDKREDMLVGNIMLCGRVSPLHRFKLHGTSEAAEMN